MKLMQGIQFLGEWGAVAFGVGFLAPLIAQSMDALNFMMSDQRVPVPNRRVVREYFRRSKTLQKRKSHYSLIDACLSQELRGDVRYLISSNLFHYS